MVIEESKILKQKLKEVLEIKKFENEFKAIVVNNDKPFTFTKQDYEVKEGNPLYTNSNEYGKSGCATAIISPNTIAVYTSENIEYPNPINWEKVEHQQKTLSNGKHRSIYQKCHIIGYKLSARFSSPHNIFIGTDTLNHGSMNEIEKFICNKVTIDGRIFLYKVTPIYMFKNDIIPIGVLFEYETIDRKTKIAGCKFCFNVEEGYKINYYDGSDIKIENVNKREKDIIKEVYEKSTDAKKDNEYKNFYIDIRTKTFHLIYDEKEKCEDLKSIRRKYIQETTAKLEAILKNNEFKVCQKYKKITKK